MVMGRNDDDYYFVSENQHVDTRNESVNGSHNLVAVYATLIAFIVLIVISGFAYVYVRCVLRQGAGQNDDQEAQQAQQAKTRVRMAIIASLPAFIFKQWDGDGNKENFIECAVCLSVLDKEDMARLLPNCKHIFHALCIDKWLISGQLTCPVCRAEVISGQLPPVPSEPPERA